MEFIRQLDKDDIIKIAKKVSKTKDTAPQVFFNFLGVSVAFTKEQFLRAGDVVDLDSTSYKVNDEQSNLFENIVYSRLVYKCLPTNLRNSYAKLWNSELQAYAKEINRPTFKIDKYLLPVVEKDFTK